MVYYPYLLIFSREAFIFPPLRRLFYECSCPATIDQPSSGQQHDPRYAGWVYPNPTFSLSNADLSLWPTFLPPFGTLTENKPIAVAELDDQEIRVSLVTFSHGEAHFSDQDRFPIPGREYPAPWEDLIYAIGELTQPLLDRAQGLALCLPFPVVYDGKGDGTISRFPGSMTIHGFSEKPVLASLREELQSRGCPIPPMTLINESDAVLLAAGVQNPGQGRYLGVTWGSSIDVGFVAPGSIVLRWPGIPGDLTLFTGGFSQAQCVPFGLVDYSKDRDCYAPGLDLYLKMVSTDYLGEIFRLVMIKAAERKLLSFGCSRDILSLTQLDLETVLQRAARLVCANLAAVIQFIGGGRDANAPVCLSLQGSAFSAPPLMAIFEAQVQAYLRDTLGLHVTLWQGDNALPVGTAAAALYRT